MLRKPEDNLSGPFNIICIWELQFWFPCIELSLVVFCFFHGSLSSLVVCTDWFGFFIPGENFFMCVLSSHTVWQLSVFINRWKENITRQIVLKNRVLMEAFVVLWKVYVFFFLFVLKEGELEYYLWASCQNRHSFYLQCFLHYYRWSLHRRRFTEEEDGCLVISIWSYVFFLQKKARFSIMVVTKKR